jgi:hypothetical protein
VVSQRADALIPGNCGFVPAKVCKSEHMGTVGEPGGSAQGISKTYRFTLTMPACVTVDAIGMIEPRSLADDVRRRLEPLFVWPEMKEAAN